MSFFKDDVHMSDRLRVKLGPERRKSEGAPPIKLAVESNVRLRLIDKDGRVEEEREGHNIFLNYGREWLSELIALDTTYATFRNDRIRYMAYGIGGTSQSVSTSSINTMQPGAHPAWGTAFDGVGGADPVQTDTDPTVTGLEWPVLVREPTPGVADYYDDISAPATFPGTGTVRFTSVLGYDEVSYSGTLGTFTSVPLSEVGLFTESVPAQTTVPWDATTAPAGERFMVAYHTFDTLSKTSSFVLQTDWEIRIS